MKKICVIGSLNLDYIITTDHLPKPGETLFAKNVELFPGGKGMNQAACCANLGMDVEMIGCIGKDRNSEFLKQELRLLHIGDKGIYQVDDAISGCAFVESSAEENSILVIKGSNDYLSKEMIDNQIDSILSSNLVIMQLEIPFDIVEYVVNLCDKHGKEVLLNPAPAIKLHSSLIDKVRFLTPNEKELSLLFNLPFEKALELYPNKIIMTAGARGAFYHDGNKLRNLKASHANVIDTTGAGDAFNGAFASAYVQGNSLEEAIKIANQVAAKTTEFIGAQSAMSKISFKLQEEQK